VRLFFIQEASMRFAAGLVAAALMFVAVGCGSSGSGGYSPTPTPTPTPTPGAGTVNIVGESGNRSFNPNPSSLPANGMITFKNTHSVTHHLVANDGSWNTGDLPPGASSGAIAIPAGGSNFHCSIHPTMVGVVNDSSGGTPPCTGQYC
jgi:plastocyanin